MRKTLTVFTGRIADRRKWEGTDVHVRDITLLSGDKTFAPTPELLWPHKQGLITTVEYQRIFLDITRNRYRRDPEPWLDMVHLGRVCLLCYCGHDKFCHRHLVKWQLMRICEKEDIEFIDGGEVEW